MPGGAPLLAALALAMLLLPASRAAAISVTTAALPPIAITSPDGHVTALVGVDGDGRLWYSVSRDERSVIDRSPLGIRVDGVDLGASVVGVYGTEPSVQRQTYRTRGVHTQALDHYREIALLVLRAGSGDAVWWFLLRAYDDGAAYRYGIPGTGLRVVSGEASSWRLPAGSRLWIQTSTANYEGEFHSAVVGTVDTQVGGPVVIEQPGGGVALVTEAALRHYSGLSYHLDVGSPLLRGVFLDDQSWQVAGGSLSPWRVLLTARSLNDEVNSDLVGNLNDPPDAALFPRGAETPWIRGGRAAWSWMSDSQASADFEKQKQYVDYAAALRAEYVTVDAGWEWGFPTPTANQFARLAELATYGRRYRPVISLWVWKAWPEVADAQARREFFQAVHAAGAVGVKIDDLQGDRSDSMAKVELQEAILRDAAAEQLMVNFHGVNKPTGLSRTFPNEITREAVRGLEWNGAWFQGIFLSPVHDAVLPFSRLVAGAADYTPVLIGDHRLGPTTVAHQLALGGVMTSPLVHFAEHPAVILANGSARELLRILPTEWDETIVLAPSAVGEVAVLARRRDRRWYVFAVNGDAASPRALSLALPFLGEHRYDAVVIEDATRDSVNRRDITGVSAIGGLGASLLPGGGFIAILSPSPDRSRPVLQGFTSLAPADTPGGRVAAYALLRDHADLVAHSLQDGVPWPEALASSDVATYPASLRATWASLRAHDETFVPGHARYLMLNPIDTANYSAIAPYWAEQTIQPLPAPWSSYEFDDPAVKTAYLNYVIAAVEFFRPTHVAIGVEANILLLKAPLRWTTYKNLNAYVYTELKARYPSLRVFTTIHYEHMRGMTGESVSLQMLLRDSYPDVLTSEVVRLLEHSDVMALSTYPFMVGGNLFIDQDGGPDRDYYQAAFDIAARVGRPLAIDQSGTISRDLYLDYIGTYLPGSEARQNASVERLLSDAHVYDFEFVINFVGWDYGEHYGSSPTSLTWAYTGLVRVDGSPKPALATWDAFRGTQP